MSETFFITPYDPSVVTSTDKSVRMDLELDASEFLAGFQREWTQARLTFVERNGFGVRLETGEERGLEIEVYDNQIVGFKPFSAKFILWYRSYIPENYQLFLSGSSSTQSLELDRKTSVDDIEGFLNSG